MKTFKSLSLLFLTGIIALNLSSCNDDDSPVVPITTEKADYSGVITNLSNNIIVTTYSDLKTNAEGLLTAVNVLQDSKTEANLTAARDAWVATRAPWESSEGFLFGPVDTDGIDPALDSWPVNRTDLQAVLDGNDELTKTFVNSLEGTLKGFHTIEFLLWGGDSNKTANQLTDRELNYLVSTTEVLADDASTLISAWQSSGGNFVSNLLTAGQDGNNVYKSQKAVLEELAAGILGIADEVGNGKINDPIEQQDVRLEESQFSNNSKTDFTNNIISIQNIYVGKRNDGLSKVIAESDANLDAQIKNEIQAAIDAIQAIPGTFTDAIPSSSDTHDEAQAAQESVRTLQTTLESKLVPLISNL